MGLVALPFQIPFPFLFLSQTIQSSNLVGTEQGGCPPSKEVGRCGDPEWVPTWWGAWHKESEPEQGGKSVHPGVAWNEASEANSERKAWLFKKRVTSMEGRRLERTLWCWMGIGHSVNSWLAGYTERYMNHYRDEWLIGRFSFARCGWMVVMGIQQCECECT